MVFGGLAQLARAPALHAGGQRFESVILHTLYQMDIEMFFDVMINRYIKVFEENALVLRKVVTRELIKENK